MIAMLVGIILGAANVGMPHKFQELCKTFKPTYELSEENAQKYLSSFDPATQSRIRDVLKDTVFAKKWGNELAQRHKNDIDPFVGACEEILRRVGPNGTPQ